MCRRFKFYNRMKSSTHKERIQLWKNNLPKGITLEEGISLENIARMNREYLSASVKG